LAKKTWVRNFKKVRTWWQGEFIGDSEPGFIIFGFRRHWTAEWARKIIGFSKREWKWIVGTMLAVLALLLRVI
jgi:hypothetical protein